MGGPVEEDELQARIDGRLPPERAEAVDAYLAAHPEEQARFSQYAEQRQALRALFVARPGEPIPARLRVAHLLAERRRRRYRQFAQVAAALGFLVLGGVGGWTARDVARGWRQRPRRRSPIWSSATRSRRTGPSRSRFGTRSRWAQGKRRISCNGYRNASATS